MKHSSMSDYDADVIPMVEYFNSVGLKTYMSCSGHKGNPYMSMFWIEFDPSVTEQDIIDFQRNHVNEYKPSHILCCFYLCRRTEQMVYKLLCRRRFI